MVRIQIELSRAMTSRAAAADHAGAEPPAAAGFQRPGFEVACQTARAIQLVFGGTIIEADIVSCLPAGGTALTAHVACWRSYAPPRCWEVSD